jgi:hypothetical protein
LKKMHWESWLLRLVLLGVAAFEIASGNTQGAIVAGEGLVVTLLPQLISRLSHLHVPRALELTYVLSMVLQFTSESTKLFEVFYYWDKLVHPGLVALTALMAGWLLLGYRDVSGGRLPIQLTALFAILVGACIGALWEFVELGSDWFGDANLQKSNADTMSDMLANDIGAFIATLGGFQLYCHVLGDHQRREMGELSRWLTNGPGRALDRFGRPIGALVALVFAGVIGAALWIDRDPPSLAVGLTSGTSRVWTFTSAMLPPDVQPLSGDWVPDERGTCRVNAEKPRPGSEKMGLLELNPGAAYGTDGQSFTLTAHYFEERPPRTEGTEMDAGIAFGIRDTQDFYLLEESALHDVLRLDRYIHGKRRDVREKLYRTHGNEWHTLQLTVQGSQITAGIDGEVIYQVSGVTDTAGGVGLWARAAKASCFDTAQLQVGTPTTALSAPVPRL